MKPDKPQKVFLDASIIIQAGRRSGSPVLKRLSGLVRAGFVSVLTTDITVQEISRHHAERDYNLVKSAASADFRRVIRDVFDVQLREIQPEDLKARIREKCEALTAEIFENLEATHLPVDDVAPSTVFSAYHAAQGFFAEAGKKVQFPDAFILERIKTAAKADDTVIVISDDNDFAHPVKECEHVSLVKSLRDLFEILGLHESDSEISRFLKKQNAGVIEAVKKELHSKKRGVIEAGGGNTNILVLSVNGCDTSNMAGFRSVEEGGPILAVGKISLTVDAYLTHGEEFDMIGSAKAVIEAEASIEISVDEHNKPSKIESLRLRSDSIEAGRIDASEED